MTLILFETTQLSILKAIETIASKPNLSNHSQTQSNHIKWKCFTHYCDWEGLIVVHGHFWRLHKKVKIKIPSFFVLVLFSSRAKGWAGQLIWHAALLNRTQEVTQFKFKAKKEKTASQTVAESCCDGEKKMTPYFPLFAQPTEEEQGTLFDVIYDEARFVSRIFTSQLWFI